MDLSSQSRQSIFRHIFKFMVIALAIQVTTAENISTPLNDDQIQLQIIENELQQLEANVLQPNKEIQHQYTATRHFDHRELVIIEKVVNKLQETLIYLNSSTQLNSEDRLKLAKSATVTEDMQKTIQTSKQNHTLGSSMVTDASNSSFGNKSDINSTLEKILLDGAVSAIRQKQFSLAEKQLQLVSNVTYAKAVETVYNNSDESLKLIHKFYDSVTNVDSKFQIIRALYNSITSAEKELVSLRAFMEVIELGRLLRKDVLNRTTDFVAEQLFLNTMANGIRTPGIQLVSDNFIYFDVDLLSIAECIGYAFLEDYTSFGRDFYEQVINKVIDTLNFQQLMEAVDEKTPHLGSKILAHRAIFNKLESNGSLNANISLLLAISMNKAMMDFRYQNLSSEWRSPYENIKNKLPASIKTLMFSSSICIKNSYHDEYLFAADTELKGYADALKMHPVYTWIPKNETTLAKFKWRVQINSNRAELVYLNSGEKLFGNESNNFAGGKRLALTTRSEILNPYITEHTVFWNFEVDGEGFQLENSLYHEYLYADAEEKLDDKRRYVFTKKTKEKTKDSKWEIIDCSDSS